MAFQSENGAKSAPVQYIVGRNPVLELLRGERPVDMLYVSSGAGGGSIGEILRLAAQREIPVKRVDDKKLEALGGGAAHQGVAASLSAHRYASLDEIFERAGADPLFVVIADGVEDPHNLGAIIRTAEVVGAHGVIIPKRRSASLTPAAAKSAAGALEHIPVARVTNLAALIEQLKQRGVWVYAADMQGESYCTVRLDGPVALVVGSEGRGLSRLIREKCDMALSLPMYGRISSLNASVAAGVLLVEIARQRHAIRAV